MKGRPCAAIVNTSSAWGLYPRPGHVACCAQEPDQAVEAPNNSVPLGRIAEPEDIADVIAFLASDEARYIAGETLEVTGAKPVSG